MSQHDMIIDNGPGSSVRADINSGLQALASLNSGASAPGVTYPFQFWADTANSRLKIRNAANSAWVDWGPLASAVAALSSPVFTGTPSAPTATAGTSTTQLATTAFVMNALFGKTSKSVAGGVDVTLTSAEAGTGVLELTGAITANINVVVPTAPGWWVIKNATSGNFSLTIKTASGAGVAIRKGKSQSLYCDGVDVLDMSALLDGDSPSQVSASTASNALTVGFSAGRLLFRSSTLSSGAKNLRDFSAQSLVVPSGATLGTVSGVASRIVILALDVSGSVEPAVVNLAGGVNLDESGVISTTAISASATSASVIYSSVARSNVPYRVVGFVDSTQATAGTWATAPSLVQGVGGQAGSAMASFGYGQVLQDVTASRSLGTTYYNTTGKTILFIVKFNINAGQSAHMFINGVGVWFHFAQSAATAATGLLFVQHGESYSATLGGGSVANWFERRQGQ